MQAEKAEKFDKNKKTRFPVKDKRAQIYIVLMNKLRERQQRGYQF